MLILGDHSISMGDWWYKMEGGGGGGMTINKPTKGDNAKKTFAVKVRNKITSKSLF